MIPLKERILLVLAWLIGWPTIVVLTVTIIAMMVSGQARAADIAPFATAAAEYRINALSDNYERAGCKARNVFERTVVCTGRNPLAELTVGVEFAFGNWRENPWMPIYRAGWKHRSQWRDGPPFNDRPESTSEALFIELKLGGLR